MIFICRQKCDQGKDNDMNTRHFLIISNIQQCTASQYRLRNIAKGNSVHWPSYPELIQKTAFSLVKSRLAIGSPGCRLVVTMPKMAKYTDSKYQNVKCILQKTAFSLVKSRLALGSPGCSFVRSSPCRKGLNTQKNSC